jgi:predicted RNase H-like HicB family nuclease
LDVVVAVAPDLPGCMMQAGTFEAAREDLIDAIELWLTVGLKSNEPLPVINGVRLATSSEKPEAGGYENSVSSGHLEVESIAT